MEPPTSVVADRYNGGRSRRTAHIARDKIRCPLVCSQGFHAGCAARGNVLDFWAAVHRLPLYEAALQLADTFHLPRNREEEPVK